MMRPKLFTFNLQHFKVVNTLRNTQKRSNTRSISICQHLFSKEANIWKLAFMNLHQARKWAHVIGVINNLLNKYSFPTTSAHEDCYRLNDKDLTRSNIIIVNLMTIISLKKLQESLVILTTLVCMLFWKIKTSTSKTWALSSVLCPILASTNLGLQNQCQTNSSRENIR